jgi:hypothetical protein
MQTNNNNSKEQRRHALAALGGTTNQHASPGAFAVHPAGVPQRPDDDDTTISYSTTVGNDDNSSRNTEVAYSAVLVEATMFHEDDISYQYDMERNFSHHSQVIEGKPWVDPTLSPDHDDDDGNTTTDSVMNTHSKSPPRRFLPLMNNRRLVKVLLGLLVLMAMMGGIAYEVKMHYTQNTPSNTPTATGDSSVSQDQNSTSTKQPVAPAASKNRNSTVDNSGHGGSNNSGSSGGSNNNEND